jgi:mono/diheme cytochrome c family protein
MGGSKARGLAASVALWVLVAPVFGQGPKQLPADRVNTGREIYGQNCAPCHGPRMLDSQVPMDLRKFPPAEKSRFIASVTKGKNQMPPFGDLFKGEDLEALWAYVISGERQ